MFSLLLCSPRNLHSELLPAEIMATQQRQQLVCSSTEFIYSFICHLIHYYGRVCMLCFFVKHIFVEVGGRQFCKVTKFQQSVLPPYGKTVTPFFCFFFQNEIF